MRSIHSLILPAPKRWLAWLLSWAVLHKLWGRRQINFRKVSWLALALIAGAFALTFPPVFELFANSPE